MREIIPDRLWTTNRSFLKDFKSLNELQIEAVFDLAIEEQPVILPREIIYCRFPIMDEQGNDADLLRMIIDLGVRILDIHQRVLIACSYGMSRSPAIATALLARYENISYQAAMEKQAHAGPLDISPGLYQSMLAIIDR